MSRKNYYFGEVVTEDELDDAFAYAEQADFALAIDSGCASATKSDTPNCTVKGGILTGGIVTKNSATSLAITALTARDDAGVRIVIPNATVALTKVGDTPEGDATLAEGDGALIAVAGGNEAWATLWAAYDEHLSDPRIDATGATVYFDIADSYHFHLDLGAQAAVNTNTARPSLADDMVLLADVLLDDNEQIRAVGGPDSICKANSDFVTMAGAYVAMTGRRGDWLALDSAVNFPRYMALGTALRVGGARDAFIQVISELQRFGASPGGTRHIGQEAIAGVALAPSAAFTALSVTAGSLYMAVADMLVSLNSKLSRGGGTLQPNLISGITGDPTYMQNNQSLLNMHAKTLLSTMPALCLGKKYGHICLPHTIVEDFVYQGTHPGARTVFTPGASDRWKKSATGAASDVLIRNLADGPPYGVGIAELTADIVAGDGVYLFLGGDPTAPGGACYTASWKLDVAPFAAFSVRFQFNSLVDRRARFGFQGLGGIAAYFELRVIGPNNVLTLIIDNGAGGSDSDSMNSLAGIPSLAIDTWYTARLAVTSDHTIVGELGGFDGEKVLNISPATFSAVPVIFVLENVNVAAPGPAGGVLPVLVDQVIVSDAQLEADMQ